MIGDNHHYGHDGILRRHCGVLGPWPIPGRLQHGWTPGPGLSERLFEEPWPKLVWSRRNVVQCWEAGFRDVIPVGAPYLYMVPPAARESEAMAPQSLLVYPFHGWEEEKVRGDMEAYAASIEVLEREEGFGPVTVCLYWLEYEDPSIRGIFEARGWSVITNGHRDDNPDFLNRQRASLLRHAYVTSNRVCTAAFYALASGRRFFLYGPPMGLSATTDPTGAGFAAWQAEAFPELTWAGFGDRQHRDVGLRELGADYKLTPHAMRDLFGWHLSGVGRLVGRRALHGLWKIRGLRPIVGRVGLISSAAACF